MFWRVNMMKRIFVRICIALVPLLLAGPIFAGAAAIENSHSLPEYAAKYRRLHQMNGDVVGFAVADLNRDGQQEIALLFREWLEIGRFQNGVYSRIASLQLPAFSQALGIASDDLDGDGRSELYLTLVSDFNAASMLVEYRGKGLKVIQSNIPYLLRSIQLPGHKPMLIGQQLAGGDHVEPVYISAIWRMGMRDGKIHSNERLDFPRGVNIFSLQPFSGNNGQLLFADLSPTHRLAVYTRESQIWKSEQKFGGTTNSFEVVDIPSAGSYSTVPVLIDPRLELGPDDVLLVPRNEGRNLNNHYANFGPSQLVAMRWEDNGLQEYWHTKVQEGGMIDFRLADADNDGENELVMAVIDAPPKTTSRGKASLLVYELR